MLKSNIRVSLIRFFTFIVFAGCFCSYAEDRIPASKSPFYVGKTVMACGRVAQVTTRSSATYINLDSPFPNQTLGLVVWARNVDEYEARLGSLSGLSDRMVCARGKITEYHGKLQMLMDNPQFLRLMAK